ncbi:heterokaryon incompatibility protein-domain-containing protein [Halenospora varia]|nr:heterokaryon incompatibility protein-domain-containing protein [Halenospora varia]
MDGTFEYKPLALSKNEIRLISIAPAGWASDELEGRLFHVSLEEAPPYEALSYVWGNHQLQKAQASQLTPSASSFPFLRRIKHALSRWPLAPTPSGSIKINSQHFHLNSNLEAALRCLRYQNKELVIWIDAICIDQFNTEERNEQVSKMRLIYTGAQEVRVWLGESYEDSGTAFNFIRELSSFYESQPTNAVVVKLITHNANRPKFDALVSLWKREYWTRVWIIQEIASGRKVTVHCGLNTVTWFEISTTSHFLERYNFHISTLFPTKLSTIGVLLYKGPSSLKSVNQSSTSAKIPKYGLLSLLLTHESKRSTDPKDKVYALVGLSTAQDDPNFIIDYSKNLREVYTDVVRYLISKGSLGIISSSNPLTKIESLPSWVPDWSINTEGSRQHLHDPQMKHVSGNSKAIARVSEYGQILYATGFRFDTIKHLGHKHTAHPQRSKEALETFHAWRKILLDNKGNNLSDQMAFARSLFCDEHAAPETKGSRVPEDQILGAFGSLTERILPGSHIDPQLYDFIRAFKTGVVSSRVGTWDATFVTTVTTIAQGRKFFISGKGYISTAAGGVHAGDILVVLFGCSWFSVLRPKENGDGYIFVGEAYVDGWMQGEAMELLEKGVVKSEEFLIW